MPQINPQKIYVSKRTMFREVERPDGTFYKLETWTMYDKDGKITQNGRTETEIPYYNRNVTVEDSTLDLIKKIQNKP